MADTLLCAEDIDKILQRKLKSTNYQLLSYDVKPFSEKLGFMGEHAKLRVLVKDSSKDLIQKFSFFVKCLPQESSQGNFVSEIGAFAKEIFTNEELFRKMKKSGIDIVKDCIPDCYLSDKNGMLVFDDLNRQGFEVINKHEDFSYGCVLVVLQSLAKLHASSLIYEETKSKELGREYRLLHDYQNSFEETFFNDKENFINLKGVSARVKAILTEIDLFKYPPKLNSGKDFKKVAEECCYGIYNLVKPTNKYRSVVCHGDLWSANFLFKYQHKVPVECKFVDFQLTRYLPPAHDVMQVLYMNTSREFRQKYMNELLDAYYNLLEEHLKVAGYDLQNIIPLKDFLQSCEEQKAFAVVQAAMYFQITFLTNEELQEIFENSDTSHYASFVDRSVVVLKYFYKNENYRHKLKESIEDLKEYCEKL